MATTRRSLADRNRAAIAADPVPEVEQQAEAHSAAETPQAPRTAPQPRETTNRPPAPVNRASDVARQGVYLTTEAFDDARAAYLGDWLAGGQIDTFAGWVAAAIDAYAARTPAKRTHPEVRTRSSERQGAARSWAIPLDTIARMRAAITADQQAGRWTSDSAWCAAAIAAAVDVTRARDGQLPTPPARLPKRLAR